MAYALHRSGLRPGWLGSAGVALVATTWPVTDSLAVHMLQHIALISIVPPLVLRGVPALTEGATLSVERGVALVVGGVLLVYAAHVPHAGAPVDPLPDLTAWDAQDPPHEH